MILITLIHAIYEDYKPALFILGILFDFLLIFNEFNRRLIVNKN